MIDGLPKRSTEAVTRIGSALESNSSSDRSLLAQKYELETAQYVADMVLELRNIAKAAKLWKVMVPLEFAYYEAYAVANRVDVPPEEVERLRQLSKVGAAIADKVGNV